MGQNRQIGSLHLQMLFDEKRKQNGEKRREMEKKSEVHYSHHGFEIKQAGQLKASANLNMPVQK